MDFDYRFTLSGIRRFNSPDVYIKTVEFQNFLKENGIAWHNSFSNECTSDFSCCVGDGKYHSYLPSYEVLLKQFCNDLFEEVKHGDTDHQDWLKSKIESFRKNYFIGD